MYPRMGIVSTDEGLTHHVGYFGWTGHVDTLESLHKAYSEMSKIGMLPPPVAEARPLI